MQSRTMGAVIAVALLAAAAVLFVVLRDDGGDTEQATTTTQPATTETTEKKEKPKPKPEVTTIVVKGGEPVGGVQQLAFSRGEDVRFDVKADLAEEVHVHGYDVIEDVAPGKPASFDFPAEIEGGFEVELEGAHTQIAELTVEPS